jgi:hypothetical protein
VIAFGEKRFDQCLTHLGGLGLVDLDTHAVADGHRAGGDHAAIDVDHTCPTRAKGRVVFQITQGGDVHTRLGATSISAGFGRDGLSDNLDTDAHADSRGVSCCTAAP